MQQGRRRDDLDGSALDCGKAGAQDFVAADDLLNVCSSAARFNCACQRTAAGML